MNNNYDPIQDTIDEAERTRCRTCGRPYEAVRPGKIQPSCSCDYVDELHRKIHALRTALHLIAAPRGTDGTYNHSRESCEKIAREALGEK